MVGGYVERFYVKFTPISCFPCGPHLRSEDSAVMRMSPDAPLSQAGVRLSNSSRLFLWKTNQNWVLASENTLKESNWFSKTAHFAGFPPKRGPKSMGSPRRLCEAHRVFKQLGCKFIFLVGSRRGTTQEGGGSHGSEGSILGRESKPRLGLGSRFWVWVVVFFGWQGTPRFWKSLFG